MIYPNGIINVNDLQKYVLSEDFTVYAEKNEEEPKGWDWRTQGFYHGNRTEITTIESLKSYIFNDEYTICYDINESYYKKFPYRGEERYIKDTFIWMYNGKEGVYEISPTNYIDGNENHKMNLSLYKIEGNYDSKYVLGSFNEDKDGYYSFEFCGSRPFEIKNENDLKKIWIALEKANEYLNNKYREWK